LHNCIPIDAYVNRYLKAWCVVFNWDEAARCFDLSDNSVEEHWEAGGASPCNTKVTGTASGYVRQQTDSGW